MLLRSRDKYNHDTDVFIFTMSFGNLVSFCLTPGIHRKTYNDKFDTDYTVLGSFI